MSYLQRLKTTSIPEPATGEDRQKPDLTALPPPSLRRHEENAIRAWLARIGEDDQDIIAETLERCRVNLETREYFLKRADEVPTKPMKVPAAIQGRTCSECRHWQRDQIGDGSGLSACSINAPRRGLPWPNQDTCNQFKGASHD
jgi:hypothetical protein